MLELSCMVAHCSNPSTWEVQAAWSGAPGQPKTVPQKMKGESTKGFLCLMWLHVGTPWRWLDLSLFGPCLIPYPVSPQCWDYMYVSMPSPLFLNNFFECGAGTQAQILMFTEQSPFRTVPSAPELCLHSAMEGCCGRQQINWSKV